MRRIRRACSARCCASTSTRRSHRARSRAPARATSSRPTTRVAGPGDARDEIWALGFRNPYRWSFDRGTGDIWIGDVGQGAIEEVDFEPASDPGGRNYGWDVMEGTACGAEPAPSPPCNDPSLTLPVHEYTHASGDGRSITGGYVYRADFSGLNGLYFFADYISDKVWTLNPSTGAVVERTTRAQRPAWPSRWSASARTASGACCWCSALPA
jgi:glucose/arabinose dehydrogenase